MYHPTKGSWQLLCNLTLYNLSLILGFRLGTRAWKHQNNTVVCEESKGTTQP